MYEARSTYTYVVGKKMIVNFDKRTVKLKNFVFLYIK